MDCLCFVEKLKPLIPPTPHWQQQWAPSPPSLSWDVYWWRHLISYEQEVWLLSPCKPLWIVLARWQKMYKLVGLVVGIKVSSLEHDNPDWYKSPKSHNPTSVLFFSSIVLAFELFVFKSCTSAQFLLVKNKRLSNPTLWDCERGRGRGNNKSLFCQILIL